MKARLAFLVNNYYFINNLQLSDCCRSATILNWMALRFQLIFFCVHLLTTKPFRCSNHISKMYEFQYQSIIHVLKLINLSFTGFFEGFRMRNF